MQGSSAAGVAKGAYVLQETDDSKAKPDVVSVVDTPSHTSLCMYMSSRPSMRCSQILIGTGSELPICVEAAAKIGSKVRLIPLADHV